MDKHEMLITTITWKFAYQSLLSEPKGKKDTAYTHQLNTVYLSFPTQEEKNATNKIKASLVFICFSFMYPGSGDSDLESDFPLQNDRLPFGSVVRNGIVLPSSGRSGNKNLNGNTRNSIRDHVNTFPQTSAQRQDWREKSQRK